MREYVVFEDIETGNVLSKGNNKKNCVVYGAGSMGVSLYDQIILNYNVKAYTDSDSRLWGDIINSKEIIPPDDIPNYISDGYTDIIVCSFYSSEAIIEKLKTMNLNAGIMIPKLLEYVEDDEKSLISPDTVKAQTEEAKQLYLSRQRNKKITIIFLVYIPQLFSSYESVYEEMLADERFEPVIVLSPMRTKSGEYKLRFSYATQLEETMKKRGYSYLWAYKDGEWLDIYSLNPDGIFYQTPYTTSQLPLVCREHHYCEHIRVMNTPYGVLTVENIASLLDSAEYYSGFLQNCWRLFFDKSNYDVFINDEYLSDKIILSGTPKVDFYKRGIKTRDTYFTSCSSKKILYTPTWMASAGRSSFLQCHEYFSKLITNRDIELVIRPHPLLIPELESSGLIDKPKLDCILNSFRNQGNCLLDLTGDYRSALLTADFAVMDISSLIYEYLPTGKPLILMAQNEDMFKVQHVIKSICYIAENLEQLENYIAMLFKGEDPLYDKRMQAVGDLSGLFPNGGTNGAYITDYIAQNIRGEANA